MSVCIILVSLTGQLIENVQVAIVSDGPDVQSPLLDLNQTLVGEAIFCASLPLPDDNVVLGDQRSIILAAAAVPEPDSVTFTSGGDRANLTVVDNDGMYNLDGSEQHHRTDFNCENLLIVNCECFASV